MENFPLSQVGQPHLLTLNNVDEENIEFMQNKLLTFFFILLLCFTNIYASESLIYFHGSPTDFEKVEPRPSTRFSGTKVVWDGEAIFATPDFRIALFYSHNHLGPVTGGIDLITDIDKDTPITFDLIGGNDLEDALNTLYGIEGDASSKGYIYLLDPSYFQWMEGLGSMERVSSDVNANLGRVEIDRRKLIDHFVKSGKIKLVWTGIFPSYDIVLSHDE